MSGKLFNPLDNPLTASSSDEDEVETSIGEGEEIEGNSSSEEEEDDVSSRLPTVKKPEISVASTENQVSDIESDPEEESDSDSETDRNDRVPNPGSSVVKFVTEAKVSVVTNRGSEKGKSSTKSVAKRSSETDGGTSRDAKRIKRGSGEEEKKSGGEETKKTYFQRVWSEEDEIVVLQGMIDYKTDSGVSPYHDMNGFYQMVKKSIGFDVSKIQFKEKLRSLKKKFENNLSKGKNGDDPTFSKPHDRKAFELSKCIWGANGLALVSAVKDNEKSKKSHKSKKIESVKQELVFSLPYGKSFEDEMANKGEVPSLGITELDTTFVKSLARFGVDDLAAQQGWSRLASEDKKKFEEQWKAMQRRELEFYSQKSGFIHDVVTKMAEAFRSNP